MDTQSLFEKLRQGDRAALAKAITLIESRKMDDLPDQSKLIGLCREIRSNSLRLAITGPPGAGKSTLIERLGLHLTKHGHRVAVLAIDPSSQKSGGSILGDKTRMERLSASDQAFIRPSPAAGHVGGVSRHTREAISLCEAAGYDIILIETVGVGQAEYRVQTMVDIFILLTVPGSGDGLQGIKRGIMEIADMVIVNKADGENVRMAKSAAVEIKAALRLSKPESDVRPVVITSAKTGFGIEDAWDIIDALKSDGDLNGSFSERRKRQDEDWFEEAIDIQLRQRFTSSKKLAVAKTKLADLVASRELDPLTAAGLYVEAVLNHSFSRQ